MRTNQRGFINILILVVAILVVGVVGYFTVLKKSTPGVDYKKTDEATQPTTVVGETKIELAEPVTAEKQVGIIKKVYEKDGKRYLDIDYIIMNPNWRPGGESGSPYTNDNSKIRTFEIDKGVAILSSGGVNNYQAFFNFFNPTEAGISHYQAYNPWRIEIINDMVVKIEENYLP